MKTETPRPIQLKDYGPTDYLIDHIHLDVRLVPQQTRVKSRLSMRPNPAAEAPSSSLTLDGEQMDLVGLALNGEPLARGDYTLTETTLTIDKVPSGPFTLDIETTCDPDANTSLSGLYRSSGNYCTQCEAEGFRRITYYLDRPDVLARFTIRMEARRSDAPVLLSNGNLTASGPVDGTERHFAVWKDPFPKPSYPFRPRRRRSRAGRRCLHDCVRARCDAQDLCGAWQGRPVRLRDGCTQTVHALG